MLRFIRNEWAALARTCKAVKKRGQSPAFYILLTMVVLSPFEYWAIVSIPDSTDYFLQAVDSAKRGDDGRDYIYVGDNLHVVAYNWRHKLNGSCDIWVDRVRENFGGKFHRKRTVMQHVDQSFQGDGIIRRTSWPLASHNPPLPSEVIPITESWFDDPEAQEQEIDIFTTGWFDCNPLDSFRVWAGFPRMHRNAALEPERERTRVVLRRKAPI